MLQASVQIFFSRYRYISPDFFRYRYVSLEFSDTDTRDISFFEIQHQYFSRYIQIQIQRHFFCLLDRYMLIFFNTDTFFWIKMKISGIKFVDRVVTFLSTYSILRKLKELYIFIYFKWSISTKLYAYKALCITYQGKIDNHIILARGWGGRGGSWFRKW